MFVRLLVALFGLFYLVHFAAGCAQAPKVEKAKPEQRICYMQQLGMTSEGYAVIASSCMTPEDFKRSQRGE